MKRIFKYFAVSLIFLTASIDFAQQNTTPQVIHSRVRDLVKKMALTPISTVDTSTHLRLAIALPLRNQAALANLLEQIYDPTSPNYRHYLTVAQFTSQFGPTEQDYQSVIAFARQMA